MGILGLSKLLYEKAPGAFKEQELKNYFGRYIAIDASMSIYQFIIAMKGFQDGQGIELTNENGEVTSHLNGLFYRTLRMVDEGLKPIYVFDGAPPKLKESELESRREKANTAEKEFERAKEEGDDALMEKMSKRTVRVTSNQINDCKKLLELMGIPVVQAPSESEAQCAELVRKGKAWAVGTEDMDALTFGSNIMLRHLNYSDTKKRPIAEIHLNQVLHQTGLSMDQFIDLCILLGCDYVPKIHGIGPQKAWEGIQKYGSIEGLLENLDVSKYHVPSGFVFKEARDFFKHPDVTPGEEVSIQFKEPDEEALTHFLVNEKLFNLERVTKGISRLKESLKKKTQGRLDNFFTIKPILKTDTSQSLAGSKRVRNEENGKPFQLSGTLRKASLGHKKSVKRMKPN
ncbi:unnamed protein product [Phytomonas sp. Hart1]|nr:unnamed protein product [Phytomonas sp. Hart1]|eukprot:CCW71156.1 unnamed protein product [Phytomonas sp. isolate Hart1]